MCGIVGIAGRSDEMLVREMARRLAHRGPDAEGFYNAPGVSLGHRRLSIIDLSTGQQPMANEDESIWIVFNGEVYNFQDLRLRLEAKGHVFRTHSDTETIIHAYEEYGDDCVQHFRGMFAFAIWDDRRNRLLLARDHLGVKPVYYAEQNGVLLFASEMKAILAAPGVSRDVDYLALDEYLTYLYTVPPRTFFRSIRQLPPAHFLTWEDGRVTTRRYWRPVFAPTERPEKEWAEEVSACLQETIQSYMVSDVPLGAFLSGGLDSSAIVAMMADASDQPTKTFTVVFEAEGMLYDEKAHARTVSQRFGTEHRELIAGVDVARLLPVIVKHFDEPFGNPTSLLVYVLCHLVRQHVTVALSGDGGDETFGGYPRYVGVELSRYYRRIPGVVRKHVLKPLAGLVPESTRGFHTLRRLREFVNGNVLDPVEMYLSWIAYFTESERAELYTGQMKKEVGSYDSLDYMRGLFDECGENDLVARAQYVDLLSFLPHNVLQYGDRMSMAHSIEVRVPFTDIRLVELAAKMPSHLKVRGMQTKYAMRQSLRGRLPESIVARKKIGFNPPMGVWLTTGLARVVEEYLSAEALRRRGFFDPEPVQSMLKAHQFGTKDYTWHLWALIVLEEWLREYVDKVPAFA